MWLVRAALDRYSFRIVANLASFLILLVFLYGRSLRFTNLIWHIRFMLAAFVSDLLLIAALVFGRSALSKVGGEMTLALQIHVPIAIATVVLYFFTVWAGYQLWRGRPARNRLRALDKALVTFRILTLITSLWVQYAATKV